MNTKRLIKINMIKSIKLKLSQIIMQVTACKSCQMSSYTGEKGHGVWNSGAQWSQDDVVDGKEIELSTQIKLVRYGVAR